MAKMVRFTKMQGAGNDYLYIYGDELHGEEGNLAFWARRWSDRHKGIGGDGLVLIGRSKVPEADFTMRIFTADGSEARMCGNASRCIGKYVYEKGLTDKTSVRLLTRAGIKTLKLHTDKENHVESVTVDMQEPCLVDKNLLATADGTMLEGEVTVCGQKLCGTFVSMGNPHFVIFTDDAEAVDVARLGSALEVDPLFPERCNIEFASLLGGNQIRVRVWERGSGITLACGTGACATAVAAVLTGRSDRKSYIVMDGGILEIEWSERDNHVYMTGPAEIVFEGEVNVNEE